MKFYLIICVVTLLLSGCGEITNDSSTIYTVDGNSTTVPKDENTTIEDATEGVNIVVQGDYYVISGSGSVTIGDGSGNTISADGDGNNIAVDGTVNNDDNSLELWYYTSTSSCCYTCGACDENLTEPEGNFSTTSYSSCPTTTDISGNYSGYCTEISGG